MRAWSVLVLLGLALGSQACGSDLMASSASEERESGRGEGRDPEDYGELLALLHRPWLRGKEWWQ